MVLLALALARIAEAQGIAARLDRDEICLGEQAMLSVEVQNVSEVSPPPISLDGFEVINLASTKSKDWGSGKLTTTFTFHYLLRPQAVGTFPLPPIVLDLGGKTLSSQPLTLTVRPQPRGARAGEDFFATGEVSDARPYAGQQIVYTWRLFRRVRSTALNFLDQGFKGFQAASLGANKEYGAEVGGYHYTVDEIRWALFPEGPGTFAVRGPLVELAALVRQLNPSDLLSQIRFVPGIRQRLQAEPLEVQVQSLPPRPEGFSGLVGQYQVSTSLSRREIRLGDPTTLKIEVVGDSFGDLIPEPSLPELEEIETYADKSVSSLTYNDHGIRGKRVFSRALVPKASGEHQIPGVNLVYFDPKAGDYRTAQTSTLALTVQPSRQRALQPPSTVGPAAQPRVDREASPGDDAEGWSLFADAPGQGALTLAGVLALAGLGVVGLVLARRHRAAKPGEADQLRCRDAYCQAKRAFADLERASAQGRLEVACELASRIVREYLGAKLGRRGLALTAEEAGAELARTDLDAALVERVSAALQAMEATRFSGDCRLEPCSSATVAALLETLEAALGPSGPPSAAPRQ